MDNVVLKVQCETFRRILEDGERGADPLDDDFIRRFNGFVSEHPEALEWKNENGTTLLEELFWYLVHAIEQKFPLETFQALVIQTPQVLVLAEKYFDEWTLLHHICFYNPTALDIVSFFVQQNPDSAKVLANDKKTPLHIACREKAQLPVIRVLVEAYPRAIEICDDEGDAPLHDACCRGAPLDVIQFLLMQKPHLCLHQNKESRLPLDLAKRRSGGDRDVIEYMTTTTTAAARALTKRLSFLGPLPRELFEQVAAYLRHGPAGVLPSVVDALSAGEMAVLFRRGDIRASFSAQIGIHAP